MENFFSHPLLKKDVMEYREYQNSILETIKKKNTLCCLPTGLGKTNIAILLAAERLSIHPNSRILFLAPTKPLTNQHYKTFMKFLDIEEDEFEVVTGAVNPSDRKMLYKSKRLIFATPQTIRNDLKQKRLNLKEFSLLVVDELHHAIGRYAYPYVSKKYLEQSTNPRILGLTASPGGTKEKIEEICRNTGIETVEIRGDQDEDVLPYVKVKQLEWVNVDLPESFMNIRNHLEEAYKNRVSKLKRIGLSRPVKYIRKKDLLELQVALQGRIRRGEKSAFWASSIVAQAIKIEHAIGLIETQGVGILYNYFKKLEKDSSKAAKSLLNDRNVSNAIFMTSGLKERDSRHPKMSKLCTIITQQFSKKPESNAIIFANFRETVKEIHEILKKLEGVRPVILIGQKEGITQKEQIETIREYELGLHNCLITTSIGEEGLSLESADLAVFYEAVASEIRQIQRRGRVGRTKIGKILVLITSNTRDEGYKWSAFHKERKMKRVLYDMKSPKNQQRKLYK
jgi:Fanconi anemia group M protein